LKVRAFGPQLDAAGTDLLDHSCEDWVDAL